MKILFIIVVVVLVLSLVADRKKTVAGIKKGMKMFTGLLPGLLNMLILVSVILYLLPNALLVRWMGEGSGFTGMILSAILGSVTLIPGFIAYPLAAVLMKNGVAYSALAVFITTLMMVGIVTLPLETKYFGLKATLTRNGLSLVGALVIGFLMGWFL